MKSEVFQKVEEIFREVFDQEELEIHEETCAEDIEDWDSLEQINLLIAMEKEFDIKFELKEVSQLKNVGEMVSLIQEKINHV